MAGSDFSTRPYSYDDVEGDVDLVHFQLTQEDYDYKVSDYTKRLITNALTNDLIYNCNAVVVVE